MIGFKFRLIGQTTEFVCVARGEYAGIDCVLGWTHDATRRTLARVADVICL